MNREIKFRAWDKKRQRMTNEFSLDNLCRWAPGLPSICKERGANKNSDIEYMQYTGLKDKHGKEIYEGDILRDSQGNVDAMHWGELPGFVWGSAYLTSDIEWDFEVIGNIYQNPELLDPANGGE